MKQTFNVGYLQTPSVKNLENTKQALFESGLVESTTPDEMLPDAIEEGLKKLKGQSSAPVDNGPIYEGKYRVRYFDVDGTVLKIEYVANGGKTTPPDAPAYDPDYLIFDEWNYDTDNYIVEQPTDIGATYKTVDNATYIFCSLTTKTGLSVKLKISSFTSIDWGDGTVDTTAKHTYTKEGEYVIKIDGLETKLTTSSSSGYLLGDSAIINYALKKLYLGKSITILPYYMCNYMMALEVLSLPKTAVSTSKQVIVECYKLKCIIIPRNLINFDTSFLNNSFIATVIISENMTTISFRFLSYRKCNSQDFTFNKNITAIGQEAFTQNYCVQNYIMPFKSIPLLESTNAFNAIITSTIMWVKDDIIEQLKVATNWSTYAEYMRPLSWYPSLTNPNA
jgi:hypothetical protein